MRARGSGALDITALALLGVVTILGGVRGGGGGEEGVDVLPFGFQQGGSAGIVQLLDADGIQIVPGDRDAPGTLLTRHQVGDFDQDPSDGGDGRRTSVNVRALGTEIGISGNDHRLKLDGNLLLEDRSSADGEALYLNVDRRQSGRMFVFLGHFQAGLGLAEQFANESVYTTIALDRAGVDLTQVRKTALQIATQWGLDIGLMIVTDSADQQIRTAYGAVLFGDQTDLYQVEVD